MKTKDDLFEAIVNSLFNDDKFQINESKLTKEFLAEKKEIEFPIYEVKKKN
jgi:hypothetical protein